MTLGGTSAAEGSWIEKELRSDIPPGKRELVAALRDLCRCLMRDPSVQTASRGLTQTEAAKRLHTNPSSLSRFLSGQTVPGPEFIEVLYKQACSDAGEDAVGYTPDDLTYLRARAVSERRRCSTCLELSRKIDSLTQQLSSGCPACAERQTDAAELASLRQEVAALQAAATAQDPAKAGSQTGQAETGQATGNARTPLPVPHRRGDRQRSHKDAAAARQVAAHAEQLDRGGRQDAALTLLRQSMEVLSPAETALILLTLRRQQQDHLADNLIHVYGRDQADRDIMRVALELHELGSSEDAGAVLRAALR